MLPCHPSALQAIQTLRQRYPETPFLTLGQTVLWDEPVKAAFCRIVETLENAGEIAPGAKMVAGVHDTDYFAKLPGLARHNAPFIVLRHNDGDTRGLWSAAGELSSLFGAEIVPSKHDLTQSGVAFDRAARCYPGGAEGLLNQETDAPLWRAIVHTEPHPLIAAEVKLAAIAPALREQLLWGFRHSLRAMGCSDDLRSAEPCESRDIARRILGWVEEFIVLEPDATLSDLYRDLIPKLWNLVRKAEKCSLQTTASMELFQFNRTTANRARFAFVDLFLQPKTREIARQSYDRAVVGSGIYTLDQFGPGALPFDVVIPGKGRGTLRLHEGSLFIETEEPITLCTGCDCGSIQDLAGALEDRFGPNIALVGKAVALISMLGAEFIFVFHEKASSYTSRTQKMNAQLRSTGIELDLHPMLRLKYAAWDALENAPGTFQLPAHLAGAFGEKAVSVARFAKEWRAVCEREDKVRAEFAACRSPRDLMDKLARDFDGDWPEKLQAYVAARGAIAMGREKAKPLETEIAELRDQAKAATAQALKWEREKGANFRAEIAPLREKLFDLKENAAQRLNPTDETGKPRRLSKTERAAQAELEAKESSQIESLREKIAEKIAAREDFDHEISAALDRAREWKAAAKAKIGERVALEKGPQIVAARELKSRLESEAELARLRRVRDTLIVSKGLHYTNFRPTAWWLPLVSPDGKWFDQLAQTARARVEEL